MKSKRIIMEPLKNNEIFGNWAILLLTTDQSGKLNHSHLADEIDVLIASCPNGIYSNVTAGEFYSQTEKEYDQISLLLSEKCEKAGMPYQIGVSHMSSSNFDGKTETHQAFASRHSPAI